QRARSLRVVAAGHPLSHRAHRRGARAQPRAGLRHLLGGGRPEDQRDRRRAELDRVGLSAGLHLRMSAADPIAPLREWLRGWTACVRAVDFEAGRKMCAPEIVAFGTVAPFVEGLDNVMAAQWHKVWGNIRDFTMH